MGESFEGGNRGCACVVEEPVSGSIRIDLARIDDMIAVENMRLVLKIDVEGNQDRALAGMRELVANNLVFMQVEVSDGELESFSSLADEMGLRTLGRIAGGDWYFSNMPGSELSWLGDKALEFVPE